MTFEKLQEANSFIGTTNIKGKEYAQVNQRIKAFRFVYPNGQILTELLSDDGTRCTFKATIMDDSGRVLGTGHAFECRDDRRSMVNSTSYVENCETSAVGRALGMCGFGIDVSIASAEEVTNAINQQEAMAKADVPKGKQDDDLIDQARINVLINLLAQTNIKQDVFLSMNGLKRFEDMTQKQFDFASEGLRERIKRKAKEKKQ